MIYLTEDVHSDLSGHWKPTYSLKEGIEKDYCRIKNIEKVVTNEKG